MQLFKLSVVLVIAEVLAVFAFGAVLGPVLAQMAGMTLQNPLQILQQQPDAPLLPLAVDLAVLLGWQYLGWGLCAVILFWLRPVRERKRTAHVPQMSRGWLTLVACALIAIPAVALTQAQEIWHFGSRAPWFDILQQRSWDWQFWLFTAVGSFALIPVLEELFYRGFMLNRLAGGWQNGPAVLLTSVLFACSHAQYLQTDWFNLLMLVNVGFVGLVLALATLYSGSLWPAIFAHALINLPMQPVAAGFILLLSCGVLCAGWRHWTDFRLYIRAQLGSLSLSQLLLAVGLGVGFALLFHRAALYLAIVAAPFWLVLVVYRIWQRRHQV
ncbi:MAG: CPBP family intramembrane glutamic endopeptidase [Rheinheimera sp.]|nr:CPBP family intramembrane glutamic endopeptidase [Rheinheimera sp.]